jgi:uncharacterized membrane protein
MALKIPFFSKKQFFSDSEKNQLVSAVRQAEKQTSGEIRVFVESHCRFVDPLDRAAEIFHQLNMEHTAARNGVLIYVALRDRQLALMGDRGIHEKVGEAFWNQTVTNILSHFSRKNYTDAICRMIGEVGAALQHHFPYDRETDINELPDDIVFGR